MRTLLEAIAQLLPVLPDHTDLGPGACVECRRSGASSRCGSSAPYLLLIEHKPDALLPAPGKSCRRYSRDWRSTRVPVSAAVVRRRGAQDFENTSRGYAALDLG